MAIFCDGLFRIIGMRVLELCLSPDYGGLEIHMRDFSRWLATRPECELFLALQSNSRLQKNLDNLAVSRIFFRKPAGIFSLSRARSLAHFITTHNIDLVHVHWKFDLPFVALTKKLSRRKFIFMHTRQMNMPGKKRDPYHRFVYGQLDAFIAITRYIENQAHINLPMDSSKIFQIYYGYSPPAPPDPARTEELRQQFNISGDMVVGLVGRISHYKGQHLLIEAVQKLRKKGINVQAFIIGPAFEKEYAQHLRQMVIDNVLQEQIRFIDFYENPYELMSCFDTVVLTTRKETFGLVLIEAMHAGTAVIGSNAGGVPEIIDDGKTGLLFESWNSDALADTIQKLYEDKELRRRLAVAGQEKAHRNFDQEIQYKKVLALMIKLTEMREKEERRAEK